MIKRLLVALLVMACFGTGYYLNRWNQYHPEVLGVTLYTIDRKTADVSVMTLNEGEASPFEFCITFNDLDFLMCYTRDETKRYTPERIPNVSDDTRQREDQESTDKTRRFETESI